MQRLISAYFNSFWLPGVAAALMGAGLILCGILRTPPLVADVFLVGLILAALGMFAAALWNLLNRKWLKSLVNFLALGGTLLGLVLFCVGVALLSMLGSGEDNFAANLTIPADLVVADPQDWPAATPGGPADVFQARMLAALQAPPEGAVDFKAEFPALVTLYEQHPDLLERYLAASPAWRIFDERGHRFATRRWMIGDYWHYELHGYYTESDIDMWSHLGLPDFQVRLTLGLSGEPWAQSQYDAVNLAYGQTVAPTLATAGELHCVIPAGDLVVELFEQSSSSGLPLTAAALAYLEEELAPLAVTPDEATLRRSLPEGAIRSGAPALALWNSFQPGLYDSQIWVNPGEPGAIYLRAYEVTHGARLSQDRLTEYSYERVGWSADPAEQFFSNTTFTIYEGDWGQPYAARFELWFIPDSGAPERKLLEQVFKIEGWQR